MLKEKNVHRILTVYLSQGTDFHPKYTGENLTCTVQGLKRSTQYKFRVNDGCECGFVFVLPHRCSSNKISGLYIAVFSQALVFLFLLELAR